MSADSTGFNSSNFGVARLALGLVLALALQATALAEQPCPLGLLTSASDPGVPDGVKSTGWSDAATTTITSGSACLGSYTDLDAGNSPISRTLKISSKRYSRSGVNYVGFLFEVPDTTTRRPPATPGGQPQLLLNGEKIILQLQKDVSGGTELTGSGASAKEFKIEVTHKWDTSGQTSPNRVGATVELYAGPKTTTCTATDKQRWNQYSSPPSDTPAAAVTDKLPAGSDGYTAEIEVPLSLLGNPTGDIGVAILVLNDTGGNCSGSSCTAYGAAFPDSLPVRNGEVPYKFDCTSWNKPDQWATGYASTPPQDVFFVHNPAYWNSVDVDAMRCSNPNPDNSWYNQTRCKLSMRTNLRSSFSTPQTRNVLYLWGDPGMGQLKWYVVEMKEGVTVMPGATSVTSASTSINVAVAPAEHPCIRAYILPTAYPAGTSKNMIESHGPFSDAELTNLISAYPAGALYDQHSAQKNLTRIDGASGICPDIGCYAWLRDLLGTSLAALAPRIGLVGDAWAQERVGSTGKDRGPVPVGGQILMSDSDLKRYGLDNVIVQVREFAVTPPPPPADSTSPYDISEEVAGIIKLIPVKDLGTPIAFPFVVGNPGKVARAISLQVDMLVPSGVQPPQVSLPTSLGTMQPGEERRIRAIIGQQCGDFDIVCRIKQGGAIALLLAVLLGLSIVLILFWWLRKH